jgi:transposase
MVRIEWKRPSRPGWALGAAMAVALVLLVAFALRWPSAVQGEIRESARPEAFLSGGARSEIVLKEIHETLRRIDARLERFERALRESEPEGAGAAAAQPMQNEK